MGLHYEMNLNVKRMNPNEGFRRAMYRRKDIVYQPKS